MMNIYLGDIDTSAITDMSYMFYNCKINDENEPKFVICSDLMDKDYEIPF